MKLAEKPMVTKEEFDLEIQKAVEFAVRCHSGQFRKTVRLPYVTHCFEVLAQVAEWNVYDIGTFKVVPPQKPKGKAKLDISEAMPDIIVWKAALCHDIPEECPDITTAQIAEEIGDEAAEVCEELCFLPDHGNPLPESKQKEQYIKTFENKSIRALVVKCADRIRNTRNFMHTSPDYAGKYFRKGEPLFDFMITRELEITNNFGPDTFALMKFSRDSLKRELVRF